MRVVGMEHFMTTHRPEGADESEIVTFHAW